MSKLFLSAFFVVLLFSCSTNNNGTVTVVPIAPTALTGTVASTTQINLSWTDNATNEDGYKIERKNGTGSFSVIGSTGSNLTTFNDMGLSPNTTYTYRVYAFNGAGNSLQYSNEVTLTTALLPSLTTAPISDTTAVSAKCGGNITSDAGSAVTARGICWSTSSGPTTALTTKTIDGTGTGSFTSNITGLSANTTYYVRAYATNANGTNYGNEISFTTKAVDITTGLVAFYPFSGNANDESGNNFNGIVTNASLTTDRFGNNNKAYFFTSSSNTYISSNIGIQDTLTFSAWYKCPSPTTYYGFLWNFGSADVNGINYSAQIMGPHPNWVANGNVGKLNIYAQNGSVTSYGSTHNVVSADNNWHNIIVSYIPNDKIYFYYDGNFVWETNFTSFSIPQGNLTIGRDLNNNAGLTTNQGKFNGSIDDVRIYNRKLLQAEISYLATH